MRLLNYIRSMRARQQQSKQRYTDMVNLAAKIAVMISPKTIYLSGTGVKELTRELRTYQEKYFEALHAYRDLAAEMTWFERTFGQDRLWKEMKVIEVHSAQVKDAAYILKYNATHAKELTA